jgi:predicted enzyme related to lactoylglutathione lyase
MSHGKLGYLQLPAADVGRAAAFYAAVFGWSVEPGQAGFEAPGLIGQWIAERPVAPDAGPLLWIDVTRMESALRLVEEQGGVVLSPPVVDDGVRLLATVRDPAGNTIGMVQHGTD